jgi:hypothetical protein
MDAGSTPVAITCTKPLFLKFRIIKVAVALAPPGRRTGVTRSHAGNSVVRYAW